MCITGHLWGQSGGCGIYSIPDFLCGVCTFFLCRSGVSRGTLASSHSLNTCTLVELATPNCLWEAEDRIKWRQVIGCDHPKGNSCKWRKNIENMQVTVNPWLKNKKLKNWIISFRKTNSKLSVPFCEYIPLCFKKNFSAKRL